MAAITATSMTGFGKRVLTETTLGASDTFTYNAAKFPILMLRNPTAGALTPTIDGDGGTTVSVGGVGPVDVSAGFSVGSIAADAVVAIPLKTISAFLTGIITITGGTGLVATLAEI